MGTHALERVACAALAAVCSFGRSIDRDVGQAVLAGRNDDTFDPNTRLFGALIFTLLQGAFFDFVIDPVKGIFKHACGVFGRGS
ncbi:MAG: hypothetical protein EOO40_10895 [Deltaproteobacteria bacterium]|nr:MAG: hypothetical protein EOO40_10895 [Deltaproteobacteria bacterium]